MGKGGEGESFFLRNNRASPEETCISLKMSLIWMECHNWSKAYGRNVEISSCNQYWQNMYKAKYFSS